MKLYPLKFRPIPVERSWGGTALRDILGKRFVITDSEGEEAELAPDTSIGESWDVADLGDYAESVVDNGFLCGNTINELTGTYLDELTGDNVSEYFGTQFPLMAKFINAFGDTPVIVHPDDTVAFERYDALGKKGCWHIMESAPEGYVCIGLSRKTSAEELFERCMNGTIKEIMNRFPARKGDMFIIPPGTLHCAGGGVVIASISESSELTFTLDSGDATERIGQIGEALDFIDLEPYDMSNRISDTGAVTCKEFAVRIISIPKEGISTDTKEEPCMLLYVCTEGSATVRLPKPVPGAGSDFPIRKGEVMVIPAETEACMILPDANGCSLIEATIPKREEKDEYINNTAEE